MTKDYKSRMNQLQVRGLRNRSFQQFLYVPKKILTFPPYGVNLLNVWLRNFLLSTGRQKQATICYFNNNKRFISSHSYLIKYSKILYTNVRNYKIIWIEYEFVSSWYFYQKSAVPWNNAACQVYVFQWTLNFLINPDY